MKKRILLILALVGLTTAVFAQSSEMKMTTPIPESISTPAKVQTSIGSLEFFDGMPTGKTTESVNMPQSIIMPDGKKEVIL